IYVPRVSIALTLSAPTAPKWTGDGTTTVVPLGPPTNPADSFVNYRLAATNQNGSRAFNVADLVGTLPAGLEYVGVYAAFTGPGACDTATPLSVNVSGPVIAVPVNPAATIPNSLGAGETFAVCLRARVVTTTPSITLTDRLDLAGYASAPTGVTGRRAYGPLQQLSVPVRTQDILTFTKPADRTYGDPPIDLTTSLNSTGNRPIGLTVVSGPCAIDPAGSKTVRITGAGTCTLRASQNNDNLAPDVTQLFVIAKAPLTVRVNDQTQQFGELLPPPCVLNPNPIPGLKYNDTVASLGALSCTTTATDNSVLGTYPLTPGGYTAATANNYDITYVPATLRITARPVTPTIDPVTVNRNQ
ncbi:MAG TPA: MBG domain-containing protein, partial [Thermomicrobiales bacterium]